MQLQVRLEPQEIQFVIRAVHNTQIMGKDAHVVSSLLTKFEKKISERFKFIRSIPNFFHYYYNLNDL